GLPGLELRTRPVRRAGLYVPGGRAAYPSTVLMTAIPATVAGVKEIALASPASSDGSLPVAILAAASIAGVTEVYRIGGAQAIAAFAYGTDSVPAVDVIAGPGNIYVTLAKREVFGLVGIDAIAGPTEILIIADETAPADFLAADLASQLEHDPLAFAVLVTTSAALGRAVTEAFEGLVVNLDRREVVGAAHCRIVLVESIAEAVQISNAFAPEHLELVVAEPEVWLDQIENAGAIFVGSLAAVSLGDYVAGTNHSLPTAGSARFSSPLGVHTFLKRTSIARLSGSDFAELAEPCITMANMEGLTAHAHAVRVRLASMENR
ncbi:MAG TPA: histidinol dehydrogenase, partial [Candidatus Dormibacteraeota bacterium]|nr:histidinol dehydrogenase [Candidatus Dormibacteraeota bacterium]